MDEILKEMQEIINKYTSEEEIENAYLTFEDIKNLGKISQEQNDTYMIIKANKGATLEIPEIEDN